MISNPISYPVDAKVLEMLGFFKDKLRMEVTSFDGKPFLTPSQFGQLSYKTRINGSQKVLPVVEKNHSNQRSKRRVSRRKPTKRSVKPTLDKRNYNEIETQECLEALQKKVKIEDKAETTSTQEGEISDVGRHCQESASQSQMTILADNLKIKRILRVVFDKEKGDLLFKVEGHSSSSRKALSTQTKEEILKHDPRLLLYFYENHLEFPHVPEFKPEKLKKL